jgi:hypothetical protein
MPRDERPGDDLPSNLAAPARRALLAAGISSVRELSARTAPDVKALHGIGRLTMLQLDKALHDAGLRFKG